MANEITLSVGASAEPDTCGSCKFFRRQTDNGPWYAMQGWCQIVMPPPKEFFAPKVRVKDSDYETQAANYLKDTDRCDLYRFSGQVYIVQRRIPPEKAG